MPKKIRRKTYTIERSPLWQLQSQKEFASLLGLKKPRLKELVTEREFHFRTWIGKTNGKARKFAVPTGPMRRVHERLKNLLDRIEKPHYLYSPRAGYSPIANAAVHSGSEEIFKVDIRQFYPSTTREHIFRFCRHRLQMSDDVAGAFAKLTTFESFAAFGSPVSPILCFLVHQDIFDGIDRLCAQEGNEFSLWVDDIAVSGRHVSGRLMYEIKRLVGTKGFAAHKDKWRHTSSGMVVTGSHVSTGLLAPSNKHHVKMRDKLKSLDATVDAADRLTLVNSLIGMTTNALNIYPVGAEQHQRAAKRQQWLSLQRREIQRKIESDYVSRPTKGIIISSDEVPW